MKIEFLILVICLVVVGCQKAKVNQAPPDEKKPSFGRSALKASEPSSKPDQAEPLTGSSLDDLRDFANPNDQIEPPEEGLDFEENVRPPKDWKTESRKLYKDSSAFWGELVGFEPGDPGVETHSLVANEIDLKIMQALKAGKKPPRRVDSRIVTLINFLIKDHIVGWSMYDRYERPDFSSMEPGRGAHNFGAALDVYCFDGVPMVWLSSEGPDWERKRASQTVAKLFEAVFSLADSPPENAPVGWRLLPLQIFVSDQADLSSIQSEIDRHYKPMGSPMIGVFQLEMFDDHVHFGF